MSLPLKLSEVHEELAIGYVLGLAECIAIERTALPVSRLYAAFDLRRICATSFR
jgi:hypothetical protein